MDSETSTPRFDKLNHSNYHFWKIKIRHILILKDLESFLDDDPPSTATPTQITEWKKGDKKAQAVIGLSLQDDILESIRDADTAKAMWIAIKNVFERHPF